MKTQKDKDMSVPLLTQEDLAKRWACSKLKVRRMMRDGRLPYVQLGRSVRFDVEDVKAVESKCRIAA